MYYYYLNQLLHLLYGTSGAEGTCSFNGVSFLDEFLFPFLRVLVSAGLRVASFHLYSSATFPSTAESNKQDCQEERISRGAKLFALNE